MATAHSRSQAEKSVEEVAQQGALLFILCRIKPSLVTTMPMVAEARAIMMADQEPYFCTTKVSKKNIRFIWGGGF